ncbi:MAG: hypothetical protein ABIS20_15560 [Thermoanaerobaculia bacterium]
MGEPALVLDDLADIFRKAESIATSPPEAESTEAKILRAVDGLNASTRAFRRCLNHAKESIAKFFESNPDVAALSAVIDKLCETEEALRPTNAATSQSQNLRRDLFKTSAIKSGDKARGIAVVDHYQKALKEAIDCMREARLKAMAMRADLEDPGDAPVFDDPDALIDYLRSHPG